MRLPNALEPRHFLRPVDRIIASVSTTAHESLSISRIVITRLEMPPIRDHEVDYENAEDDGEHSHSTPSFMSSTRRLDMPPLVDNPAASMTYTFFTDMTPMSFNNPDPPQASTSAVQLHSRISPPASPLTPDDQTTLRAPHPTTRPHGKRRDASYIPRPPNAFILFRSSFIRSEQVPGKVEGNHSTLSKIIGTSSRSPLQLLILIPSSIGMYWKSLSREERESWEAKAVIAQAEHRKKYPDWRFRPGANAMAKLKIKDGGTVIRRRSARGRTKDPPDDGDGGAGDETEDSAKGRDKGKRKAQTKGKEESRCEKIANLLVEGKKGADLEKAMKQWEGMMRNQKETSQLSPSSSSTRPRRSRKTTIPAVDPIPRVTTRIETTPMQDVSQPDSTSTPIQSDNSAPLPVGLSTVPLTHMFKRSLSLPSSNPRLTLPESTITLPSDAASPGDWEASRIGTPGTPSLRHHPHSQTATTGDTAVSFPLLCTPFTPQASYGPRQLQWEDEEARRRSELSQEGEYWWPSSGLEDQIADTGCERPDMTVTSDGMGYEDTVGQFDHQYNEVRRCALLLVFLTADLKLCSLSNTVRLSNPKMTAASSSPGQQTPIVEASSQSYKILICILRSTSPSRRLSRHLYRPTPRITFTPPNPHHCPLRHSPPCPAGLAIISMKKLRVNKLHQPLTRRHQHQSRHGTKPLVGRGINISLTILVFTLARTTGIG